MLTNPASRFLNPDLGHFLFRVILGFSVFISGLFKYNLGIDKVEAIMVKDHIPEPLALASAYLIVTLEIVGGLLTIAGLKTRLVALLFVGEFFVATFISSVPDSGWYQSRLPLLIWGGFILLFLSGTGKISMDALFNKHCTPK